MQDEKSLVSRAQKGDEAAFTQLYEEYFDRIYRYTMIRIGNQMEAEDITQQVFLKARSPGENRPKGFGGRGVGGMTVQRKEIDKQLLSLRLFEEPAESPLQAVMRFEKVSVSL